MDLPTKARKDSQGICFLGKLKFDDFLRHYLGENPGDVVWDDTGLVIGESVGGGHRQQARAVRQVGPDPLSALIDAGTHRGLWFHTIGQRKGIV